jgi:hypothetical protein
MRNLFLSAAAWAAVFLWYSAPANAALVYSKTVSLNSLDTRSGLSMVFCEGVSNCLSICEGPPANCAPAPRAMFRMSSLPGPVGTSGTHFPTTLDPLNDAFGPAKDLLTNGKIDTIYLVETPYFSPPLIIRDVDLFGNGVTDLKGKVIDSIVISFERDDLDFGGGSRLFVRAYSNADLVRETITPFEDCPFVCPIAERMFLQTFDLPTGTFVGEVRIPAPKTTYSLDAVLPTFAPLLQEWRDGNADEIYVLVAGPFDDSQSFWLKDTNVFGNGFSDLAGIRSVNRVTFHFEETNPPGGLRLVTRVYGVGALVPAVTAKGSAALAGTMLVGAVALLQVRRRSRQKHR